jgi:sec-independent protein translocase protein TatB
MSFWEMVVIGLVALIVLGPEKLPSAIRSTARFVNGIRQFGQQMKAELSDELRAHELHQSLKSAEEKGMLGLTPDEIRALAELRQAAADVNNPYAALTALVAPEADTPTRPDDELAPAHAYASAPVTNAATNPSATPATNNVQAQPSHAPAAITATTPWAASANVTLAPQHSAVNAIATAPANHDVDQPPLSLTHVNPDAKLTK